MYTVQRDNSVYCTEKKLRKLKNIGEMGLRGACYNHDCLYKLHFHTVAAGKLCTDSHGNGELLLVNIMKSTGFAKLHTNLPMVNV